MNPTRSKVVILDNTGSDILNKMVLEGIYSVTLPSRFEVYYLTPQIVVLLLKNLVTFARYRSKGLKRSAFLFQMYLLSCIEYMEPRVVVTFIDNNQHYQALSRLYKKAEFYYVKNGARSDWDLNTPIKFSMTNFVCWGPQDREYYEFFGHHVDTFMPVGPLISSYYKTETPGIVGRSEYDICLVSQFRRKIMDGYQLPELRQDLILMDEYLSRYLASRRYSLCIATCSQNEDDLRAEIEYFKKKYPEAIIIEQNRAEFSTYKAMDLSNLVISVNSTAAFEAYSLGKKVLLCNLIGHRWFDGHILDDLTINRPDYTEFETKLDDLLNMSYEEYWEKTKADREYVVPFDPERPAHKYLRNLILANLNINGG